MKKILSLLLIFALALSFTAASLKKCYPFQAINGLMLS